MQARTWQKGMEFSRSVLGDTKNILCRRNAEHSFASSGNRPENHKFHHHIPIHSQMCYDHYFDNTFPLTQSQGNKALLHFKLILVLIPNNCQSTETKLGRSDFGDRHRFNSNQRQWHVSFGGPFERRCVRACSGYVCPAYTGQHGICELWVWADLLVSDRLAANGIPSIAWRNTIHTMHCIMMTDVLTDIVGLNRVNGSRLPSPAIDSISENAT